MISTNKLLLYIIVNPETLEYLSTGLMIDQPTDRVVWGGSGRLGPSRVVDQ